MSQSPNPEVSIIIPAFEESRSIGDCLKIIREFMSRRFKGYEVIVVDDGSSDSTADRVRLSAENWAELRLLTLPRNRGKGYAVRTGVMHAQGDWLLVSDADLSTPIEEIDSLMAHCQTCQIVIGSRSIPGARIIRRQSLSRLVLGRGFNLLARLALVQSFADTQCGFKLFQRAAAQDIFARQKIDGFAFDVEVLYLAKKLGYRVCEEPVVWNNDDDSKVKMVLDPIKMFADLLRIRWTHRRI